MKNLKLLFLILFSATFLQGFGQNEFQHGISYQAVARDRYGKEFVNENIEVVFSIVSESPLGDVVYQEIHNAVTSKYGVFSLVIGKGTPTKGGVASFSQIGWALAPHYLKVEVKIDNDLIDMGTMQFLAVPYALYAFKSLEPGPAGPKGNPGDPASDDQTLSYNGSNLIISGGNTVNLSNLNVPHQLTLIGDTLSIFGGNKVGLDRQQLDFDTVSNVLALSGGSSANLSTIRQDLMLNGNLLTITKKADPNNIDLSKYLQDLTFTPATGKLKIKGGNEVDLSALKDNTDNQQLTYDAGTNTLSLTGSSPVSLGSMVAFRAKKIIEDTGLATSTDYDFIASVISYNIGSGFNSTSGIFTVPVDGIYTFSFGYNAGTIGNSKTLKIFLNNEIYEVLNTDIAIASSITRSLTMRLLAGDEVKPVFSVGMAVGGVGSGTGSFSGFRVY